MKMRNKGKVHPFTSPSSNKDSISVLKLLPAAILALVSVLSSDDREVLAYMINKSLKSTNPSSVPVDSKSSKKLQCPHNSPALFDCDCFHCYMSFWNRWNSSLNRERIHEAIEAFEEHLSNGEQFKSTNGKSKRKEKMGRRKSEKTSGDAGVLESPPLIPPENQESLVLVLPEDGVAAAAEEVADVETEGAPEDDMAAVEAPEYDVAAVEAPAAVVRSHKGLARKVLPDVMGIFSSRLWSLWSPNV